MAEIVRPVSLQGIPEVLQERKTGGLALLRVELCGVQRAAADAGCKRPAVIASGAYEALVGWNGEIRMHKVKIGVIGQRAIDRSAQVSKLIPADMRNLEAISRETHHVTGKDSEAPAAGGFFAGFEEQLIAEANAEIGTPGAQPFCQRFPKAGLCVNSLRSRQKRRLPAPRPRQACRVARPW